MDWKLFADLAEIAGARHVSVDVREEEVTVADALDALITECPALRERVFEESGRVRAHISILQNGTDIRELDGLDTVVGGDDELALLPPVSGG